MADDNSRSVERPEDFGQDASSSVARWLAEIKAYDKTFKTWSERSQKIAKRYRDDRESDRSEGRSFNILWSNIQTLGPSLYSKTPIPDVTRRYKDRDPIGRAAATVLERCLTYTLDAYDFDATMKAARDDYLISGRGQVWVRYVPRYGDPVKDQIFLQSTETEGEFLDDAGAVVTEGVQFDGDRPFIEGEEYRPVVHEEVICDHIPWSDFGHTPAPTWAKVTAVWKRELLTREQMIDRFGKKIGNAVTMQKKIGGVSDKSIEQFGDVFKRAEVYEIWDKTTRKAVWISPGYTDGVLDEKDDPLGLEGFFPCPRPAYATMTTDTLVPVPDYVEYQSQALELDTLTQRISLLIKALRVAGVYNSDHGDQMQGLIEGEDNKLIPVDNWAAFAEKGGLQGAVSFMPVKEIAEVLTGLVAAREKIKQDLYEITGISDIIRGNVDPREKLGQSQIKSQFAGLRMQDRQTEIARFVRDVLRIKAEIVAEQFAPETILEMSGWQHTVEAQQIDRARAAVEAQIAQAQQQGEVINAPLPPDAMAVFQEAVALLKEDHTRSFRIDIETDSTVFEDSQAEKQSRVEFLEASGAFLERAILAGKEVPTLAPLLGEMLLFGIRGFKAGRQLEATFEEALEDMANAPPPPDPVAAQAQADEEEDMANREVEMARIQLERERAQQEMELKREEMAANREVELFKADAANRPKTVIKMDEQQVLAQAADAMQTMATVQVEALTQAIQALVTAAQSMEVSAQAVTEAVSSLGAPKRIVRDRNGRPVGIETLQ